MKDAAARSDLNLATAWEAVARTIPHHPAARGGATVRTWDDIEQRAARLAGGLHAQGVGPGA
jgi:acyl-CoA synthetase (AMP-forming)/AMP-acid ligase II